MEKCTATTIACCLALLAQACSTGDDQAPATGEQSAVVREKAVETVAEAAGEIMAASTNSVSGTTTFESIAWYLQALEGKAVSTTEPTPPSIYFNPEDGRYNGYAGCNNYFGGYTLQDASLTLGPAMSTRRACPTGMDVEAEYLGLLSRVAAWTLDSGKLVLLDNAGGELARYVPASAQ